MSDVAETLHNDRERFREYKRSDTDGWDTPDPRTGYDTDPADMSDEQIKRQHDDLLRLQKQELTAGNDHIAQDMARRRNDLFKEAKRREIHTELV